MIRVLIVDDHPLVLEGLKSLFAEQDDIVITALCQNAVDAIRSIGEIVPDVALLDINLPDISGIELCHKIKSEHPAIKTIALTTYSERSYVNKMLEVGASGYLMKSSSREEIIQTIKQVFKGGLVLNVPFDLAQTEHFQKQKVPLLTPREKEVLLLISEGFTNPQIAEKIFVSVLTVNSHRKNLLNKFEVGNTAALIREAARMGLV